MREFYKKTLSFLMVTAFAFLVFGANVQTKVKADEVYELDAHLSIVSEDWEYQRWGSDDYATNAKITGDKEYKVAIDFAEVPKMVPKLDVDGNEVKDTDGNTVMVQSPTEKVGSINGLAFAAIIISDGEAVIPNKHLEVKSVFLNGSEEPLKLKGRNYSVVEDGALRTNLFNSWVSEVKTGQNKDGNLKDVNATPLTLEENTVIEKLEINFELVDGISFAPKAYLQFADSSWGEAQYWQDGNKYKTIQTGDLVTEFNKEYSASLDFTQTSAGFAKGVEFFDVEVSNGEVFYPQSYMEILEVLVNGEKVTLEGSSYTSSDDNFSTRTNLFNAWVGEVKDGRTKDGVRNEDISPKIVNISAEVEIRTIEVKFKLVKGLKMGALPLPQEGTTAFLNFADENFSINHFYGDDESNTKGIVLNSEAIMGYGQYEVGVDLSGVTGGKLENLGTLDLSIVNGELYFPWNYVTIDEIKVNGEVVEFNSNSYTTKNVDNSQTNIYNTWATELPALARFVKGIKKDDLTAVMVDPDDFKDVVTINIKFTINEGEPIEEEEYEMPEDFEAFMMFADGPEAWKVFDPIEGSAIRITGDGTYTIKLTKDQAAATAKGQGAKVFLIDITDFGKAMKSIGTLEEDENGKFRKTDLKVQMVVKVDGVEVSVNHSNITIGDLEDNGRLRIQLHNEYSEDLSAIDPTKINPDNEISIEFTLSGSGIGEKVDLPEEPEQPGEPEQPEKPEEPETPKEKSNTLAIVLGVVGSVVVIGGVLFGVKFYLNKKQ